MRISKFRATYFGFTLQYIESSSDKNIDDDMMDMYHDMQYKRPYTKKMDATYEWNSDSDEDGGDRADETTYRDMQDTWPYGKKSDITYIMSYTSLVDNNRCEGESEGDDGDAHEQDQDIYAKYGISASAGKPILFFISR